MTLSLVSRFSLHSHTNEDPFSLEVPIWNHRGDLIVAGERHKTLLNLQTGQINDIYNDVITKNRVLSAFKDGYLLSGYFPEQAIIKYWDPKSGQISSLFEPCNGTFYEATWSFDSKYFAFTHVDGIEVWDSEGTARLDQFVIQASAIRDDPDYLRHKYKLVPDNPVWSQSGHKLSFTRALDSLIKELVIKDYSTPGALARFEQQLGARHIFPITWHRDEKLVTTDGREQHRSYNFPTRQYALFDSQLNFYSHGYRLGGHSHTSPVFSSDGNELLSLDYRGVFINDLRTDEQSKYHSIPLLGSQWGLPKVWAMDHEWYLFYISRTVIVLWNRSTGQTHDLFAQESRTKVDNAALSVRNNLIAATFSNENDIWLSLYEVSG